MTKRDFHTVILAGIFLAAGGVFVFLHRHQRDDQNLAASAQASGGDTQTDPAIRSVAEPGQKPKLPGPGAEPERAQFTSANGKFLLDITWLTKQKAELTMRTDTNYETILWTSQAILPAVYPWHRLCAISEDGESIVFECDQPSSPGYHIDPAFVPLLFFANGKLVRSVSFDELQTHLDARNPEFAIRDVWNNQECIHFFEEKPEGRLYCRWLGALDRWLAWEALTGKPVSVSESQQSSWNEKGRRWALQTLQTLYPRGPRSMSQAKGSLLPAKPESGNQLTSFYSSYSYVLSEDAFVFLAARHVEEDKPWIENMLFTPFSGGATHSSAGQVTITASARWGHLGDTLLAKWEGKWPPGVNRPPFHNFNSGNYFYLGKVGGFVTLPFLPRTTEGPLYLFVYPASEDTSQDKPSYVIDWPAHFIVTTRGESPSTKGATNANSQSNQIEYALDGLTLGKYSLQALWKRKQAPRGSPPITAPEPGDYISVRSEPITVMAGGDVELSMECTNHVGGDESLYDADVPRLAAIPATRSRSVRQAPAKEPFSTVGQRWEDSRKTARAISRIAMTNQTIGPITLHGMTYGRLHRYHSGEVVTDADAIVVWFQGDRNNTLSSHPARGFQVVASNGRPYGPWLSSGLVGMAMPGTNEMQCVKIEQWPRRDKTFILEYTSSSFYGRQQNGRQVGRIELTNLAWQEFPVWQAEPLPASRSLANVQATLFGFKPPMYEPEFEFRVDGKLSSNWQTDQAVEFEDATGNRARSLLDLKGEGVIKFHAEVFRKPEAAFGADEQWIVPVVIPKTGAITRMTNATVLQGVNLTIVAVTGTGQFEYDSAIPKLLSERIDAGAKPRVQFGGDLPEFVIPTVFIKDTSTKRPDPFVARKAWSQPITIISRRPHIALQVTGLRPEHRLYVGSEVVGHDPGGYGAMLVETRQEGDVYFLPLAANEPGRAIRLTFGLQAVWKLEFLIPVSKAIQIPVPRP